MPQVYIESLGCARNQVDSEIMMARLTANGWCVADEPDEAEVIVINTCSFIESASHESIDTILALAEYKTEGRCRKLIVTGCLPERYRRDSATALPEVDVFLGTGAYDQVVAAVLGGFAQGTCVLPDPDSIDIQSPVLRKPHTSHAAYLKIAEGCSRGCTFCIIPKLRGRQRSRPVGAIVEEAQGLIAGGVKELTLVAQETTAYGHDVPKGVDLAQLMKALAELDPSVWIRFLYGHPQTMTTELIRTVAAYPNICPYFDIPIQHASESVLKRMGRSYTSIGLLKLFESIRREISPVALRTTVLVGLPGETEEDVNQLAHLMADVRFDHLGVFTYSDADDLPSHHLKAHVDESTSQSRLDRLMALQKEISEENLATLNGREMTVMVEKEAEPGIYAARSMYQAPEVDGCVLVRFDQPIPAGALVTVKIVETLEYDLVGEMV
jgi:ribosomal protein S12 methylthiotransferase